MESRFINPQRFIDSPGLVVYQLQKGSLVGQLQRSETTTRREDIITAIPGLKSRCTSWREIE